MYGSVFFVCFHFDFEVEARPSIIMEGGVSASLSIWLFEALCVSVNEQVVHGIPTNSPLKNGDIVSIDCGVKKNNYFGDHAYTFEVGEVSKEIKKLLKVTKESLYLGIKELKVGNKIGDVSNTIQSYTESFGYGVVRELVAKICTP